MFTRISLCRHALSDLILTFCALGHDILPALGKLHEPEKPYVYVWFFLVHISADVADVARLE